MRYFSVPTFELEESEALPRLFGKRYAPIGQVTVGRDGVLDTRGVELIDLDGETLAMAPETCSWAFLSREERRLFGELHGKTVGWLEGRWPARAQGTAAEFVAQLFRRGLVGIDGERSVDPRIFADSHNTPEAHLVELLLTEKCNLACGYCLAGTNPRMPTMSREIAVKSIDLAFAMAEATSLTFEFSGGEPFLKFDLMRSLTEYIRNHPGRLGREVHITVQTNATLLTERRVAWVKENQIYLGLSIDGDPSSHDASRPQVNGEGSFSKVISGIDLLQRAGVPFGVLVVLNRSNVGSLESLVDFLLDNGISAMKLNPVSYLGTARGAWDDVGITEQEAIAYFQGFARLLVRRGFHILEDNLRTMLEHIVSKRRPSRCLRGHCGAGESFQAINAKGEIFPCGRTTQTPAMVLGDVLSEGRSLSAPGRTNQLVQEIKRRRPGDLEGCATCHYRQLCQAGCSAQAFERYGTVRHRTPECSFYKTMYPFLMRWLSFDERALGHLGRSGYLGAGAALFAREFLTPAGGAAWPAHAG